MKLIRITTVPISLHKLLSNQLKYMSVFFEVIAVSSKDKLLQKVGKEQGVKTHAVNMTRKITPIADFVSLCKLYSFIKKEKPVIVHTHTPKAGLLGMMAAKMAGVPIRLHTVAGLPLMEATGAKRTLLNFIEKTTCSCATTVYPNSKNLHEIMLQNKFCSQDKLKVIGSGSSNGIDTTYFKLSPDIQTKAEQLKRDLDIADDDFTFIFIGRIVRDKGIEELISSFKNISKHDAKIKLLLVGPTEPELDPLTEASEWEIANNPQIISVGYQDDVRAYLAISHVLAFPSYREGFPNVPMQAGCFELPCIVTNINGCNEIIHNEVNGLIIPKKDASALQNAMERVIFNKDLYQKLKSNARRIIVDQYEQTFFWALLHKEYQDQFKQHGIVS